MSGLLRQASFFTPSILLPRATSFDERPPSTSNLLRRAAFFAEYPSSHPVSFFTPNVLLCRASSFNERPPSTSGLLRRASFFMPSGLLRRASFFTPSILLHAERPSLPNFLLRRASFFTPRVLLHAECPSSPSILLHTQGPSSRRRSFFAELSASPSVLLHTVPHLPWALCFVEHHSHYAISSCHASYCTSSPIHQASFLLPGIIHPTRRVSISTVRGMPTVTVKGCRFLLECDTTVFSFVYTCIFNSLAWPIYLCYADRWL